MSKSFKVECDKCGNVKEEDGVKTLREFIGKLTCEKCLKGCLRKVMKVPRGTARSLTANFRSRRTIERIKAVKNAEAERKANRERVTVLVNGGEPLVG
jgi:hypothetical protein